MNLLKDLATRINRKMEQKGITTYTELVTEIINEEWELKQGKLMTEGYCEMELENRMNNWAELVDEKNIRRRSKDVLNVLTAIGMTQNEKGTYTWTGSTISQFGRMNRKVNAFKVSIAEKRRLIQQKSFILNQIEDKCMRIDALIQRNIARLSFPGASSSSDAGGLRNGEDTRRISLPFLVLSVSKNTPIEIRPNNTLQGISFSSSSFLSILDEGEILRRMTLLLSTPKFDTDEDAEVDAFINELFSMCPMEKE